MTTSDPRRRRAPVRRKAQGVPMWAGVLLAGLIAILVYGLVTPKAPSPFDRPEAQVNQPGPPWTTPRGF